MKITGITIFIFLSLNLVAQNISESQILETAEYVNDNLTGKDIGDGVIVRSCRSIGRTLIYSYDVPTYWDPIDNIEEELLQNLKVSGEAKTYYENEININYYYYKGNSLIKAVKYKYNDFSPYDISLGEYLDLKGHAKSKGVNFKIKVPHGWEVREGNLPNVIKVFSFNQNLMSILVKDNLTFFSRSQAEELLSDQEFTDDFILNSGTAVSNGEIIDKSVMTIGTYPSLTFKIRGDVEQSGINFSAITRSWIIYYEDKLIVLNALGIKESDFEAYEKLYLMVINSIVFPEQYL